MYKIKLLLLALFSMAVLSVKAFGPAQSYYVLKVYHYKTSDQEAALDQYFKNAYKPALKRAGSLQVGVFKAVEQDTNKRFYVLITFSGKSKADVFEAKVAKDEQYLNDAKDFLDASYDHAPYNRIETILLQAFKTSPVPGVPQLSANKPDRIYELRSYESPTEKYYINKVHMFNEGGETVLFNRLKFNAVFYGDVIVGSHMPNLMYMTAFESKADRDQHWATFSADPEWKSLSGKPEYQHNVSKADIIFLHPTEYSDF